MGNSNSINSRDAMPTSVDDAQDSSQTLALKFTSIKLDSDLSKRYVDRAFASMMEDAMSGEREPVEVINKRLFREGEDVPLIDNIQIDKTFVMRLLGNRT